MRPILSTSFCAALLALTAAPSSAEDAVNYEDHIRPIFQQACFNCHNADKARGGVDLTTYRATVAGGASGEIVFAESLEDSVLLGVMDHSLEPKMPPKGDKVSDEKLELIRQWIKQGLRETASSEANKPKKPRVDLSVGSAAVGRPDGPPIMPEDMPLGPVHHTPRAGAVADVAGHPWSPIVATTGQRQVLIHHTQTGELLGVLPFDYGQPQTLRFSWTGKLLMVGGGVGGASGTVALYDVRSGNEVARVGEEVDEVLAADLDPTQRFVALGGPGKRVKFYSVATGELVHNLDKHTEWVTAIAFSPAGDYLASGDRNGGIHIWEADTGLHVYRLDGHGKSVTALSWRYDGKVLASSGEDGQARLWEMKTGKQVKNWNAHGGGAMSVAFAEDGRLVTTGRDGFVRVWDAGGAKKHEVKAMGTIGLSASFDTTSKAVVAGDLSGGLVRWSLEGDAKQVSAWSSNPPPIAVALSQAMERLAAQTAALEQAQQALEDRRAKVQQAGDASLAADEAIKALRASVKAGEQDVPKLDAARKSAGQRLNGSKQALGAARQAERQAAGTLKAKADETQRLRRDHERAVIDLDQARRDHARAVQAAQDAAQKAEAQPGDEGLAAAAAGLAQQAKDAEQKAQQHEAAVAQQAERLAGAAKREDEAKAKQQAEVLAVDQAQQMEQARKQERDEANKAYEQARNALNHARQQVRPQEDKRKKAQEAVVAAKAAEEQAVAAAAAAQAEHERAQRAVAKWQAAELRLRIDALRRQRDEQRAASGDPNAGAKPQAEIDALLPEYQALREAAGF